MKKFITIAVVLLFALSIFATQGTHVFWYKATTNNYNIDTSYTNAHDSLAGPNISDSAYIHENMIATGTVFQHSGNVDDVIALGNDTTGNGACAFIWSKDLNEMKGSVTSALVRGEYRDGFLANSFNVVGTMNIKVAVVDFQGNIDGTCGSRDNVAETAQWEDFSNPLGQNMTIVSGTDTTIVKESPHGKTSAWEQSTIEGTFFEIDVTEQVNYILSNSGEFAIVFLIDTITGGTGKINLYGDQSCGGDLKTNEPWTTDGNTEHLLVVGDITKSILISTTVKNITNNSAKISWNSTALTTAKLFYGLSGDFSNTVDIAEIDSMHSTNILGLTASTLYNYKIISTDTNGLSDTSTIYSFTTQESQIQGKKHVIWYNAIANNYTIDSSSLNSKDSVAGPNITGGTYVYESMIATGVVFQSNGGVDDIIAMGNSSSGKGGCAFIWSKDLNEMTGTATSALVRGEYRDGFSGDPYNVSGTMNVKVAVVDYQGNIDSKWSSRDNVSDTAKWEDSSNPLGQSMTIVSGTDSTFAKDVPQGKTSAWDQSAIEGTFFEIDVTKQVNYILSNSGEFAIVFLIDMSTGGTGKINLYGDQSCAGSLKSIEPWTTDGNTEHLLIIGDISGGSYTVYNGIKITTEVQDITNNSAKIYWNSKIPTTAKLYYGLLNNLNNIVNIPEISSVHSADIAGLTVSTLYNYKIVSTDTNGFPSTSSIYSFYTQRPPVITSTTGSIQNTVLQGALYLETIVASDIDGDTLSFQILTSPDSLIIDSATGVMSWTPVNSDTGQNSVSVMVTDGFLSDTLDFTIEVININDTPTFVTTMDSIDSTAVEDSLWVQQIVAIDPDAGTTLKYSLLSKPDSMSIDENSGVISWTPTNGDVGVKNITAIVSDSLLEDTLIFRVYIGNTNDLPTIDSITPNVDTVQITEEDSVLFTAYVSDMDLGDSMIYIWTLNGDTVSSSNSYLRKTGLSNSGIDTLLLIVSDGVLSVTKEKFIAIENKSIPPTILSPVNGAQIAGDDLIAWIKPSDPDLGDTTLYSIEIAENSSFDSILVVEDSIKEITIKLDSLKLVEEIPVGKVVYFRVKAFNNLGYETDFTDGSNYFIFKGSTDAIERMAEARIPKQPFIKQNNPNPFNPVTVINFGVPKSGAFKSSQQHVVLQVFDIRGKLVKTLINSNVTAGYHNVIWDGRNVSSGVYVYKIDIGGQFVKTMKMLLMK